MEPTPEINDDNFPIANSMIHKPIKKKTQSAITNKKVNVIKREKTAL